MTDLEESDGMKAQRRLHEAVHGYPMVRARIGRLESGSYGLVIVPDGEQVLLDGEADMFRIEGEGTIGDE